MDIPVRGTFVSGTNLPVVKTSDIKDVVMNQVQSEINKNFIDNINDLTSETIAKALPVTYAELKRLITKKKLKVGQAYIIKDYECITNPTKTNITSAGHKFSILGFAISNTKLGHDCYALPSYTSNTDVVYFQNADLTKWKIKYDVLCDPSIYPMASESGKGWIYEMIDEHNNLCSYDFKNLMFIGSDNIAKYTFSLKIDTTITDGTINNKCFYNNIFKNTNNVIAITADTANTICDNFFTNVNDLTVKDYSYCNIINNSYFYESSVRLNCNVIIYSGIISANFIYNSIIQSGSELILNNIGNSYLIDSTLTSYDVENSIIINSEIKNNENNENLKILNSFIINANINADANIKNSTIQYVNFTCDFITIENSNVKNLIEGENNSVIPDNTHFKILNSNITSSIFDFSNIGEIQQIKNSTINNSKITTIRNIQNSIINSSTIIDNNTNISLISNYNILDSNININGRFTTISSTKANNITLSSETNISYVNIENVQGNNLTSREEITITKPSRIYSSNNDIIVEPY